MAAALPMNLAFHVLGSVPQARPHGAMAMVHIGFNYTFWLNLLFGVLAAALFWQAWRAPVAMAHCEHHQHHHHHHNGAAMQEHTASSATHH